MATKHRPSNGRLEKAGGSTTSRRQPHTNEAAAQVMQKYGKSKPLGSLDAALPAELWDALSDFSGRAK